jgi:hypothetical protein
LLSFELHKHRRRIDWRDDAGSTARSFPKKTVRMSHTDNAASADLDKFLAHPQSYVAGTKMTYSGIQDPERRADLIGFLRTLSDNPVSLPSAPEKAGPSGNAQSPPQESNSGG